MENRDRPFLKHSFRASFLNPLKTLMAELCLYDWMEPRLVAHPIRAGVGDGNTYHQLVNKSLIFSKKQSRNYLWNC